MILQALNAYYKRLSDNEDSGVAPEGFQKQSIPFLVVINDKGEFKGLQDTRTGEGKKKVARIFTVPRAVKRTIIPVSNLLWDNPAYVFGRPKPDKKKDLNKLIEDAKPKRELFAQKIIETFPSQQSDKGTRAVIEFLKGEEFDKVFSDPLWPDVEESGSNITFQLEGEAGLICQSEAVIDALATQGDVVNDDKLRRCLITGEMDSPVRLHSSIKGVWGAQSSGANIVSFNLSAFCSYGKEQGFNAPVGKRAESAYTTALNTLLAKNSSRRIQVGDASTVFWAEKPDVMEDLFGGFFGEPPKGESEQENNAIKALYSSPKTGAKPLEEDLTRFFVLGLSPNASRIAVRFWYQGTVKEVARNIRQHFDDCEIVHGPKDPAHLSLWRLLVSTALQGKSDNIQPNLSGEVMKSILTGAPYPRTLLSGVIRRIKAEHEVTYARASLIKAILVREARFKKKKEKEVGMSLDLENKNIGYLLGRLFSVLEKIQEEAGNATIRERFYSSASSTPITAFPQMMRLRIYHLAKLDNKGRAVNLERLINEIMDGVKDFPSHLDLQNQGRFSVGYCHQRQDFFTKKTIETKEA